MTARFGLTDFGWPVIQPPLPAKVRGVARVDDRRVLNGIFWRLRTQSAMGRSGALRSSYDLCQPLQPMAQGRPLARILQAVSAAYDGDVQMIDASSIRVRQHGANGQKKISDPVARVARAAG